MKLSHFSVFLFYILLCTYCSNPSSKPDKVIEQSPGPKPAWITGQKKQDSPKTEYYVGYGSGETKTKARQQSIHDVSLQISRRIMTQVYSIDISKKEHQQIIEQTSKITTRTILFDLKIKQEYYVKKLQPANNPKVYYEYYVYTAYPTKSLTATKELVTNYLRNQANKALQAYETAMRLLEKAEVSEAAINLTDAKIYLDDLSFHQFPLTSLQYPDIKNNSILASYVDRTLIQIKSHLFISKINDKQTGRLGKYMADPFVVMAYYQYEKKQIPYPGVRVQFFIDNQLAAETVTNKKGLAEFSLKEKNELEGQFEIKARVKYDIKQISMPFSPNELSFSYSVLDSIDIGMVVLEEKQDKEGQATMLAKTVMVDKIQQILTETRLSSTDYIIKTVKDKSLFYQAVNGNQSALLYFKRKLGSYTLLLCHVKSQFSSRFGKQLVFYRSSIHIQVIKGDTLETTFSESVKHIKGGAITDEKAVLKSVMEAGKKLLPKLKASFLETKNNNT